MSTVDQTLRTAIVGATPALERGASTPGDLLPGEGSERARRWLSHVIARLEQTEGSRAAAVAALWKAHQSGDVVLSRCDLPQCFDGRLVSESETVIARGVWHFVRLGRLA